MEGAQKLRIGCVCVGGGGQVNLGYSSPQLVPK